MPRFAYRKVDGIALDVRWVDYTYALLPGESEGQANALPASDDLSDPPGVSALIAYAAKKRWEVETGGISVSGIAVATDDRSKLMIIGARASADADPNFTTDWKTVGGTFVSLNAAQIVGISDAVSAFVSACFAKEAEVKAAITDIPATITDMAGIDAAFAQVPVAY